MAVFQATFEWKRRFFGLVSTDIRPIMALDFFRVEVFFVHINVKLCIFKSIFDKKICETSSNVRLMIMCWKTLTVPGLPTV